MAKKKVASKTNPLLSEKIPSNKKKGGRKRVAGK
jgi:hypothetical protein